MWSEQIPQDVDEGKHGSFLFCGIKSGLVEGIRDKRLCTFVGQIEEDNKNENNHCPDYKFKKNGDVNVSFVESFFSQLSSNSGNSCIYPEHRKQKKGKEVVVEIQDGREAKTDPVFCLIKPDRFYEKIQRQQGKKRKGGIAA